MYVIFNKKEDKPVGFDAFGLYCPERFGAVHIFNTREEAERALDLWYEFDRQNLVVKKITFTYGD